ncbi:porphobilinogen synthase [Neisseria meningitidis]|nr:porphobilinogen synthase [Neisseria meningitidis]
MRNDGNSKNRIPACAGMTKLKFQNLFEQQTRFPLSRG